MTTIDIDFKELGRQFMVETVEILDSIEDAAILLEESPTDAELLRAIFRGAHTLKGNASCLGFNETTHVAHALEDVLDCLVEQTIVADTQFVTLLLQMVDAFRDSLPSLAEGIDQPPPALREAAAALTTWRAGQLSRSPQHPGRRGAGAEAASRDSHASHTTALRVDLDRLDQMVNLTGELAVARGRLGRVIERAGLCSELVEVFAETERLSQQVQDLVTSVRMVPVGSIFRPFVRTVRDLAAAQEKKARLVVEGADVEVDLSIVEHLRDPLVHMIRNALDHGIEKPDVRVAKGKCAEGRLTLRARHEGGRIVIELHDDGVGLDAAAILAKARGLGLTGNVPPSQRDIYRFILEPGFSTSVAVTELSGRGVGMDVVRRNVEALRGSIEIENRDGALFTIRLPLTVAIIDGFTVGVGNESYILPLDSVVECLELRGAGHQNEGLLDLRGELLPFIELGSAVGLQKGAPRHVVVVESYAGRVGLAVDRLEGQSQTVIKPLGRFFGRINEFSGSSILSDGRVALVLDVTTLIQRVARRSRETAA